MEKLIPQPPRLSEARRAAEAEIVTRHLDRMIDDVRLRLGGVEDPITTGWERAKAVTILWALGIAARQAALQFGIPVRVELMECCMCGHEFKSKDLYSDVVSYCETCFESEGMAEWWPETRGLGV